MKIDTIYQDENVHIQLWQDVSKFQLQLEVAENAVHSVGAPAKMMTNEELLDFVATLLSKTMTHPCQITRMLQSLTHKLYKKME